MDTRALSTLIREEKIELASVPYSLETGRNLTTRARSFSIIPLQLHEPRWQRNSQNACDRDAPELRNLVSVAVAVLELYGTSGASCAVSAPKA